MRYIVWAFVSVSPTFLIFGNVLQTVSYSKSTLCDVQERLTNDCMQQISVNESTTNCCVRCSQVEECIGVSVDKMNKICYKHTQCSAVSGCKVVEKELVYLQKNSASSSIFPSQPLKCVDGTWNATIRKCDCNWAKAGELCERHAHNCSEIPVYHPSVKGYFSIIVRPPGYTGFRVFCMVSETEVWTLLFRNAGNITFDEPWTSFINGFPEIKEWNSSHWVGLKHMRYLLGSNGKDLRMFYRFRYQNEYKDIYIKYSNVIIGDADTNYTLTYSNFTVEESFTNVTSADCLKQSNMTSFSTYDADHDDDESQNCADSAQAGWWFSRCNYTCNPLGLFASEAPDSFNKKGYILLPGIDKQWVEDYLLKVEMYFVVDR